MLRPSRRHETNEMRAANEARERPGSGGAGRGLQVSDVPKRLVKCQAENSLLDSVVQR